MTNQEIFDRVLQHLRTQGRPSKTIGPDNRKICAYRGEGGTRCAIGCLLPDEKYHSGMENTDVLALLDRWPELGEYLGTNHPFLRMLQLAHDCEDSWDDTGFSKDGEQRMLHIAEDHGLAWWLPAI